VLDRLKALDDDWKPDKFENLRRGEPFILVTTSALEVGVDVSSDVLITELCEPDSFVQRIGRCARRVRESGEVHIIARENRIPPREELLWDYLQGRSAGSLLDSEVKQELNHLNTAPD